MLSQAFAPSCPPPLQIDPAHLAAEQALTEEHIALGERGAKELMHDRRRAHLDVYLICAVYRAHQASLTAEPTLNLCEEDARVLDDMLREASAIR